MTKSVLSIQSHVVHGYVGNKAATFPLQTQGWDVDVVNTVNFSNHTGYGQVKGNINEDLEPILDHLNDVLKMKYQAIITGYIPNSQILQIIKKSLKKFKSNNPNLLYLLDPVMGDNDYLYVDKSCIQEYLLILSEKIVDIITPNQFEVELLVGFKIVDEYSLTQAINLLHTTFNIKYIVITSLNSSFLKDESNIYCAISTISQPIVKLFKIPIIKSYFTGVGDLFSALLLEKLFNNQEKFPNLNDLQTLEISVNQVLTIMNKTLKLTHKMALEQYNQESNSKSPLIGKINDLNTMKYFELRIIQAKDFYDYNDKGEFISTTIS